MPTIEAGGVKIAYEIVGSGPPLLMMHGFAGGRRSFANFASRLTDRFTVIEYDQRDCGDTEAGDDDYDMSQHGRDAAALVRALGFSKVHVYGQSNGGAIAQTVAFDFPDLVDRLILGATTPGVRGPRRSAASIADMEALSSLRPPAPQHPSRYFAPGTFERRPDLQSIFSMPRPASDPQRLRRRANALEGYDGLDRLREIVAPTLVLGGWSDQMIPPKNSWMIAEQISGSRLVMLEGVGHALTWEAPDRVGSLIMDFLTEDADA